MTETAKQDTTKKPAEPAATESAAPRGKAPADKAAEPEAAAAAAPADDEAKPELDETKRKFREALERKHQAHTDGAGKGGRDDSKINGAHGPAASRRNFRRKSG